MKKRFRLLLLYLGYYKLVLRDYGYVDCVPSESSYIVFGLYEWKYGMVHLNFKRFIDVEFFKRLFEHLSISKEREIEYTLSQIKEVKNKQFVYSFFSTIEYRGTEKVQSSVGVS